MAFFVRVCIFFSDDFTRATNTYGSSDSVQRTRQICINAYDGVLYCTLHSEGPLKRQKSDFFTTENNTVRRDPRISSIVVPHGSSNDRPSALDILEALSGLQ